LKRSVSILLAYTKKIGMALPEKSSSAEVISPTAWNDDLLKDPHAVADKRRRVQKMFAAIAAELRFE